MIGMPPALLTTLDKPAFRPHPPAVIAGHRGHQLHAVAYYHQDSPQNRKYADEGIGVHAQNSRYLGQRVVYQCEIKKTRPQDCHSIDQDQNETRNKKRHSKFSSPSFSQCQVITAGQYRKYVTILLENHHQPGLRGKFGRCWQNEPHLTFQNGTLPILICFTQEHFPA
jgi:hypothetical protein